METFKKAKEFIYRNARPLDLARWQYHFENGSREPVLKALSYYQNEDGGFGHALEADAWNPNSSPIQTWCAIEILREINFTDAEHPMMQGVLTYLASGKDFEGKFWYNTVKSNNDYPHAPWWHTESESTCHTDYNPTAYFAGFIIQFSDKDSDLYQLGCRIAKEAYEAYVSQGFLNDMHTALCYIRLAESIEESGQTDVINLSALKAKLVEQVKNSITRNKSEWETSYVCKPSQFFNSKNSIFYADNKELADYECTFIEKTQLSDGSWTVPWGWADYPEQWAVAKNWWKSNGILVNMLYLKNMGKYRSNIKIHILTHKATPRRKKDSLFFRRGVLFPYAILPFQRVLWLCCFFPFFALPGAVAFPPRGADPGTRSFARGEAIGAADFSRRGGVLVGLMRHSGP